MLSLFTQTFLTIPFITVVSCKQTSYRAGNSGAGNAADFCWGFLSGEGAVAASSAGILQLWQAGRVTLLEYPNGP